MKIMKIKIQSAFMHDRKIRQIRHNCRQPIVSDVGCRTVTQQESPYIAQSFNNTRMLVRSYIWRGLLFIFHNPMFYIWNVLLCGKLPQTGIITFLFMQIGTFSVSQQIYFYILPRDNQPLISFHSHNFAALTIGILSVFWK